MSARSSRKVHSALSLARVLAKARAKRRRIVFTNGVYDLLHAGHVTLLQKAKRLGDLLVVGLNSDASVRRLKGPQRPMAPQADRGLVVAALEPVDYVAFFDEDTPYELIRRLKPDVLVKGGDYAQDQIVGRDLVKKVVRIPLVKGRSTSALIRKVLDAYGKS
jgi:D-beta-D-heptose 7-phosphate kinase/D-beta-D-heptose 1-phosphate adenosyltransferase